MQGLLTNLLLAQEASIGQLFVGHVLFGELEVQVTSLLFFIVAFGLHVGSYKL